MVRILIITTLLLVNMNAQEKKKKFSIYEANCVQCHSKLDVEINRYFYKYLLKYSSERNVKNAMFEYLKNPSKEKTVMSDGFINRFGIKKKSNLSDEKLKIALDTYWEKYKVFGKLK